MICPLCGHHFEKAEAHCSSGCPLSASCRLMCCPRCRYQLVGDSSTLRVFKKLFRGLRRPVGRES